MVVLQTLLVILLAVEVAAHRQGVAAQVGVDTEAELVGTVVTKQHAAHRRRNTIPDPGPAQTCRCAKTSGNWNSCCATKPGGGINTGDFCGSWRSKLHCNTPESPVCCASKGKSQCCPKGSSCSYACMGGGGGDRGSCGCLPLPKPSVAQDLYDEPTAKAFAELASATTCSGHIPYDTWYSTYENYLCEECRPAGFVIEKGSSRLAYAEDKKIELAVFALIGRVQVVNARSKLPAGSCVMVFRGTMNAANWKRNFQTTNHSAHEVFGDSNCEGHCGIHSGFIDIYSKLKPKLDKGLEDLGCGPGSGKQVFSTGHSLGAATSTVVMYDMQLRGYKMGMTYNFNSPRVGNEEFAKHFNKFFGRPVPLFRITIRRDPINHTPHPKLHGKGWVHVGAEAYYGSTWDDRVVICGVEDPESFLCAKRYRFMSTLKHIQKDHCMTPLLAHGNICTPGPFCGLSKDAKFHAIEGLDAGIEEAGVVQTQTGDDGEEEVDAVEEEDR